MRFPTLDETTAEIEKIKQETSAAAEVPDAPKEEAPKEEAPDYLDLDSVDKKIKWQGQEYSKDDLNKAFLRQQDYTKKTMSHSEEVKAFKAAQEQFSEQSKYALSLETDIQKILKDPALVDQFLEIYPKQFHGIIEKLGLTPTKQGAEIGNGQSSSPDIEKSILAKVKEMFEPRISKVDSLYADYEAVQKEKIEAANQKIRNDIDKTADELGAKYKHAKEPLVMLRAEALINHKIENGDEATLSRAEWETLYKTVNDLELAEKKAFKSEEIQQQKQANLNAKDSGAGGGTPTHAPPKLDFKESTKAMFEAFKINQA